MLRLKLLSLGVCLAFCAGCVAYSPEQQAKFDAIQSEFEQLKAEAKALKKKIDDGSLTVAEAKVAAALLEDKADKLKEEYKALKESGLSTWEIIAGLLGSVAAGALGLRGGQKLRTKEGFLGL